MAWNINAIKITNQFNYSQTNHVYYALKNQQQCMLKHYFMPQSTSLLEA